MLTIRSLTAARHASVLVPNGSRQMLGATAVLPWHESCSNTPHRIMKTKSRGSLVMPIQLPDARHLSDEALQVLRLRALRGIELGYTELDLADLLGVCHETISRWWTAYHADGLEGLPGGRPGRPLGSGRALSDAQGRHIRERIDYYAPEQLGLPHALWARRAVRDLIRRDCGVDLAERTVGLYLHRWGYTS